MNIFKHSPRFQPWETKIGIWIAFLTLKLGYVLKNKNPQHFFYKVMRILKNNLFSNNDIIKSNNKFQKKLKLTYITYMV